MAVTAVVFDVGETLVDEQRYWVGLASELGVGAHVLWAALGVTIERGEEHTSLWGHLGMQPPAAEPLVYQARDLYPDALACLEKLRSRGYFLGVAGNQTVTLESWVREAGLPVELVTSSASLGVRKPDPRFFELLIELCDRPPAEIAYVGDRVDNDVVPAAAAGLVAVHVRRGPWGYLQDANGSARLQLDSLAELPEALARV